MNIQHSTLQSLADILGSDQALRQCLPVSFFMVLEAAGYLPEGLSPGEFCQQLDRSQLSTDTSSQDDWSRPALSRLLRHKYHAPIVSWSFEASDPKFVPPQIDLMQAAGYIETPQEIAFFQDEVFGHPLEELSRSGYPILVTTSPGFGGNVNKAVHTVVLLSWSDNEVKVFDPDKRNPQTIFTPEYFLSFVAPKGAGTIVLPKNYK